MKRLNYFEELKPMNREPKKRGWRFWFTFWSLSLFFLTGWFLFLEYKKNGWVGLANLLSPVLRVAPIEKHQKEELESVFKIASLLSEIKEEQTFLVLLQNNYEIRPGGGYIGSFGILKIKEGKVTEVDTHDTNIFDDRLSTGIEPPYPMKETLKIKDWEMRDSNWSPDFPTNAQKAIELYHLQGGGENFNGVIALSTRVLSSFLDVIGPVQIDGFPGEYTSENAITKLEYQVEKGYIDQDIEKGQRKYIMKYLSKEILKRAQDLSIYKKKDLLLNLEKNLNEKDIMINFFDPNIQTEIEKMNWDGEVVENNQSDYLLMLDANLAAYKTDLQMVRNFEYTVDFTKKKPLINLSITYTNTARNKDWMTSDYQSYLRVYTPNGSWLLDANNHHPLKFGEEFNKKYFGTLVQIPINQSRKYTFKYELPEKITFENYNLLIQKQSGITEIKGKIKIISPEGQTTEKEIVSVGDWSLK